MDIDFNNIISWIEAHPTIIDLIKWVVLIAVGFFTGIFGFFRKYNERPIIKITEASKCLLLEENIKGQVQKQAAYILYISIKNPTIDYVVAEQFYISFKKDNFLKSYSQKMERVTLPSRPIKRVGEIQIASSVFFTDFQDGCSKYTQDGKIPPKHSQSGYIMASSHTHGNHNPFIRKEKVTVKVSASLASGKTISSSRKVDVHENPSIFEAWIPGLIDHLSHSETSNSFAE